MKLRENILSTLLLAIGFILHQITPGIIGGMKFDFLLIFMFIAIYINRGFKNALLTGILAGLLSAMATTFPGGQLPNIIDKIVTSLSVYILFYMTKGFKYRYGTIGLVGAIGTFISGFTFLSTAALIVGLPVSMNILVATVVVPTALVNGFGICFIYKTIDLALGKAGLISA